MQQVMVINLVTTGSDGVEEETCSWRESRRNRSASTGTRSLGSPWVFHSLETVADCDKAIDTPTMDSR